MKKSLYLITGILFFIFCFLLVYFTHLMHGDDYLRGSISHEINILSVISECVSEYINWGGRFSSYLLFLLLKYRHIAILMSIVNPLMFISILAMGFRIIMKRWPSTYNDLAILILSGIINWVINCGNQEAIFWYTGSVTYLWALFFNFLFIMPYVYAIESGMNAKQNKSLYYSLYLFLIGFIGGGMLELVSSTTLLILLCLIIYLFRKYKKIYYPKYKHLYIGVLGMFIGLILIITAPGNFIRMEVIPSFKFDLHFWLAMGNRYKETLLYMGLLFLFTLHNKHYIIKLILPAYKISFLFILAALLIVIPNALIMGWLPRRTIFLSIFLIIIAMMPFLNYFICNINKKNIMIILTMSIIYFLITYSIILNETYQHHQDWKNINEYVLYMKGKGCDTIAIKKIHSPLNHQNKFVQYLSDKNMNISCPTSSDSNFVRNMTKYYGVKQIHLEKIEH